MDKLIVLILIRQPLKTGSQTDRWESGVPFAMMETQGELDEEHCMEKKKLR